MADIEIAKKEDLDGLATKSDLSGKANVNHNHDGVYATAEHTHDYDSITNKPSIPDVSGLATQSEVNELRELIDKLSAEVDGLKGGDEPTE